MVVFFTSFHASTIQSMLSSRVTFLHNSWADSEELITLRRDLVTFLRYSGLNVNEIITSGSLSPWVNMLYPFGSSSSWTKVVFFSVHENMKYSLPVFLSLVYRLYNSGSSSFWVKSVFSSGSFCSWVNEVFSSSTLSSWVNAVFAPGSSCFGVKTSGSSSARTEVVFSTNFSP